MLFRHLYVSIIFSEIYEPKLSKHISIHYSKRLLQSKPHSLDLSLYCILCDPGRILVLRTGFYANVMLVEKKFHDHSL